MNIYLIGASLSPLGVVCISVFRLQVITLEVELPEVICTGVLLRL